MTDCEICRNHELCRLENKDKIKNCFYVYPTKEYLASKTEEYKLGYNKAIDDFARGLDYLLVKYAIENTLEPNINDVKFSLDHITKIISRVIEQLKEGGKYEM